MQQLQRFPAPCSEGAFQAPRQHGSAEHAAVEQQGIRDRRRSFIRREKTQRVARRRRVLVQKAREMARDRRIAGVRQAELDDGAASLPRLFGRRSNRKESIHDGAFDFFPRHFN